jgi:4-hydroxythreonine-4-phosphate dehydrogenase
MIKHSKKDGDKKIMIGISHGDINGISYEVIIKALNDNRITDLFTPVIYGLSKVLSFNRKQIGANDFNYKIVNNAAQVYHKKTNIINVGNEEVKIEYGSSTAEAGDLAYKALEAACRDLRDEKIHALVTAPLNKANVQSDEFHFPGHTEYLTSFFGADDSLMIMVHDNIRIGTITGHIPVKDISSTITEELLIRKTDILHKSLQQDFNIQKPKIAILSLNPHAGDNGVIGHEDDEVIVPAIRQLKEKGYLVYGPYPADGFFGSEAYRNFDAVLAMYHDQGLIPFKLLAFEGGVNFTAGLPVVRTSPAHGTAYDKAGKNIASHKAMREAMYLALDIYRNREASRERNANPLQAGTPEEMNNKSNKNNHEDA